MSNQVSLFEYGVRANTAYEESLKKRFKGNAESLLDEELLSGITGISIEKVKKYVDTYGVIDIAKVIDGLDVTATQKKKLALMYELCRRINSGIALKEKEVINSSSKAGNFFVKDMQFLRVESFKYMLLDSASRVIEVKESARGTINEAPVYVREIMREVLNSNAKSVILAHNHPAGSTNPSSADIEVTRKIKEALEVCDISIVDHVIVADDKYISFAERGLL